MIPDDRRLKILDALSVKGYLSVEELAELLYVSIPTVRRDLNVLAKEGAIHRTHGGASYINYNFMNLPFALRNKMNMGEKERIGRLAAELVADGDSVFIDSSSTCLCLAKELKKKLDLKILTNGIPIAQSFSANENVKIEIPCGTYDINHASIFGSEAVDFIKKRHADYSFISCAGIEVNYGITGYTRDDISVKKAFQRNSKQTVLLMDSSKFNLVHYYGVFDFENIDVLVCDKKLPDELEVICHENGIDVIVPEQQ